MCETLFLNFRTRKTNSGMSERQKLVAATFLVNARNAARRAAMPQPALQPRGSEEWRLLDEIHERVDLQHEITCSTFFHDE